MCHISREKSATTPGGRKTISFQQVRSAPKTCPIVYETYVILRHHLDIQPLSDDSLLCNLVTPVSREGPEHITVSDIILASSHTSLTLFLVISDWRSRTSLVPTWIQSYWIYLYNLYKWFRMQQHDWTLTSPKGPTSHLSLSACTGYRLWLTSRSRCLHIEQPPAPSYFHSLLRNLRSTGEQHLQHWEAQNHIPEHFCSPFLAGGLIFPPPSGMLNPWLFSSENSSLSSTFDCILKKENKILFP